MKQLWAGLMVVLIAGGAALAADQVLPEEVAQPVTWGGASRIIRVRHLWLADQPDETALRTAKQNGVTVVINLRDPSEFAWDEQSATETLGMTYYNVPIAKDGPFSAEQFEKVDALVERHEGSEVLIHCSAGGRAAAWLGANLVEKHAMTEDAALDVARAAGLSKPGIEKLRAHLRSRPTPLPAGSSSSP